MSEVALLGSGMVTGVGFDALASCAAIHSAIDGFQDTVFMDAGGEWFRASQVRLTEPWERRDQLAEMLAPALLECAQGSRARDLERIPVILCIAEPGRPGGSADLDRHLFLRLQRDCGLRLHPASTGVAAGKVGIAPALQWARRMLHEEGFSEVMVAGVDSLITTPILSDLEQKGRLLTSRHFDGFLPGEAAAAVLLGPPQPGIGDQVTCLGIGYGLEKAPIDSGLPLRADGLVEAFRQALADAGATMREIAFRITDLSGPQYYFKEASLAVLRTVRDRKDEFDIWHPCDCIGEVGAAIGPIVLAVALDALTSGYAPGDTVLCHFANDDGRRAALVLSRRAS